MKCLHCGQEQGPLDELPCIEEMVRNLDAAGYDASMSVKTMHFDHLNDRPYREVTVRVGERAYQYGFTDNVEPEKLERVTKSLMLHLLAEGIGQPP